jgi:hypothetical protein
MAYGSKARQRVVDYLPVDAPFSEAFIIRGRVTRQHADGSMDIVDLDHPHKLRWIPSEWFIIRSFEGDDANGR